MQELIQIRSQGKRNIIVCALLGMLGLFLAILVLVLLPKTFYLVGIFLISAALVSLLLAWVKFREPSFSWLLSKDSMVYQHRHGSWTLSWHNIQRVDVPNVSQGMGSQSLDMVAIKIKDYPEFLQNISPRLMTNILMEQRPLLFYNMPANSDQNCSSGNCYNDELLENDYFKDDKGQEYKGIQAMFANRMTKLRQRLGYDVFVSSTELDRSGAEFVILLNKCQQQVVVLS
jgi:hypothetical protein